MDYNFHKILIIHPAGIGDLVVLTPALKILKENFPDTKIDLFVPFSVLAGDILEQDSLINRVFKFSFVENTLFNKIRFIYKLRKEKYDLSILPTDVNHLKGGVLSFLIGAKLRVGERKENKKGLFYTHTSSFDETKHLRETNINLLKTIGIKVNPPFPLPFLKFDKEKNFANEFLTGNNLENKVLIGLHPSTVNHQIFKRWPKKNFIELGQKILHNLPDVFIMLFIDPDEKELCLEMKNKLNRNTIIINNSSLKQVAALIDKCKIFIASDCGLSHIATTTRTNLIAIFGPTNPGIEGPIGDRVHIIQERCEFPYSRHRREGNRQEPCKCLTKITPDRVFNEIKKILA